MSATLFDIIGRKQEFSADVAEIDHFDLVPGTAVQPDVEVTSPGWSLYCLDVARDVALFVELDEEVDLSQVPFVYAAQYLLAKRAITVPLGVLSELGRLVPAPKAVAFLLSTGRCGSTLASRIFHEIPGVCSLSEPDALTNLALARQTISETQMRDLIAAVVRLDCHSRRDTDAQTVVIKPRSEAIFIAPQLATALPDASFVFMYRDALGYVNSLFRFLQRVIAPEVLQGDDIWPMAWPIVTANAPVEDMQQYRLPGAAADQNLDLLALSWVLRMDAFNAAVSQTGPRLVPLHYADLLADRRAGTKTLLTACAIAPENVDVALRGFDQDAHAGSSSANAVPAKPLTAEQRARVRQTLTNWGRDEFVTGRLGTT